MTVSLQKQNAETVTECTMYTFSDMFQKLNFISLLVPLQWIECLSSVAQILMHAHHLLIEQSNLAHFDQKDRKFNVF